MLMDTSKIRDDFPILKKELNGKPLIYFDNACTSLKPRQVIDAITEYYTEYGACAERSVHTLSTKTTERLEEAREKVAKFIHARKLSEVIWTKNTTEAINLVAHSFRFERGNKVVTTNLEHSSGLLPWQELAKRSGINLEFVMCNKEGELTIESFKEKIDRRTKMVSVIVASNVAGTRTPIEEITKIAHDNGAVVLADGAQSVPHSSTDVKKSDVDFLAFSGHKMCGPTGIGALYGKEHLLKELSPFIIGGGTIDDATLDSHKLKNLPDRLEGGIQDYAGAFGFGAAVDYLQKIGMENIEKYEQGLSKELVAGLLKVPNLSLIGPQDWSKRNPLASFNIKGMEPHDIASFLNNYNIAVRSGTHCAYPFHKFIGKDRGSARASLYFYNMVEEIGVFIDRLNEMVKILV